jgi:hypothetical protein
MARLTLNYSDLYTQVSNFLGLTVRGTAPTGTDLTTCKDIVDRGLRQFLYPVDEAGRPYHWEFLKVFWTLNTVNDQWKYALPVGFADLCSTFYYDSSDGNPPLLKRSAEQILDMRSDVSEETGYPRYYAITPSKYDLEIGTVYELWLYPDPDQVYSLNAFYIMDPIQLSGTSDLAIGGIRATEAILENCLAEAEVQEDDTIGIHSQRAREMVLKAIKFDRVTKTDKIGNLYRDKDKEWPVPRQTLTNPNMDNVYQ